MSTTNEKIMQIARRVLRERGPLTSAAVAEVVNIETRDGVHTSKLGNLFWWAKDIEKLPNTRPVEYKISNQNVDAAEPTGND